MSVRVQLPPGCSGIDCADGTRYSGKKGGSVVVEDRHAAAIQNGKHGPRQAGLLSGTFGTTIGTKKGRWCGKCRRLWNAWNVVCPKCGHDTVDA